MLWSKRLSATVSLRGYDEKNSHGKDQLAKPAHPGCRDRAPVCLLLAILSPKKVDCCCK
jgi:hypothetical protein